MIDKKVIPSTHYMPLDTAKEELLFLEQTSRLQGTVSLSGAKNAVLVSIASLLLTQGKSVLKNVPHSHDVLQMLSVLEDLGAVVAFDQIGHELTVDTSMVRYSKVTSDTMKKMRASVLVMGPLLARFSRVDLALPGGCLIGARPIDLHLKNFVKMGVTLQHQGDFLTAIASPLRAARMVLDYPSVGATENLLMAAVATQGTSTIINAALEPEVLDLISLLRSMGARITVQAPATLIIEGIQELQPVEHTVMPDRLEAGSLLLATAVVGGVIDLPEARWDHLEVFLAKLQEMGHSIEYGKDGLGIRLVAVEKAQAVSFVTAPYPGFPTDLQAPMMVAQCLAEGISTIHETVFENRLLHARELQKMGAQITIQGDRATIKGVDALYGAQVIATDIRASCALAIAGLVARGTTTMAGIHHWRRGYENLEQKLSQLGAHISLKTAA